MLVRWHLLDHLLNVNVGISISVVGWFKVSYVPDALPHGVGVIVSICCWYCCLAALMPLFQSVLALLCASLSPNQSSGLLAMSFTGIHIHLVFRSVR